MASAVSMYWLLSPIAEAQSNKKQTVCSVNGTQMICKEVDRPTGYLGEDQWCRLSPTGILGRLAMCVYDTQVECERRVVKRTDVCLVNPEFSPAEANPPPTSRVEQPPILLSCEIQRVADERSGFTQGTIQTASYVIRDQGTGAILVEREDRFARYEGTISETMISFSRNLTGKGEDFERMKISRLSGEAEKTIVIGSSKTLFRGYCKKLERHF